MNSFSVIYGFNKYKAMYIKCPEHNTATPGEEIYGKTVNRQSNERADGLSARVLKECSSEISPMLALIYNESLAQGTVPDDWRQANVAPVFKKGEKYNAANYRPVSLTCIWCKTLEHIIVSIINKHLAFESIHTDCQHGFQSQRSCETRMVQFYHDMVSNLDGAQDRGQKQTDVIIMDLAKAFDRYHTGGYCTN